MYLWTKGLHLLKQEINKEEHKREHLLDQLEGVLFKRGSSEMCVFNLQVASCKLWDCHQKCFCLILQCYSCWEQLYEKH